MRARDNHERWLVSYADFITLLFAFFVVLFAASNLDESRVAALAESYSSYLQGASPQTLAPSNSTTEGGGNPEPDEHNILTRAELLPIKQDLEERLAGMVGDGKVSVSLHPRGLVLSLREAAFFPIGKAAFRVGAEDLLEEIGDAIRRIPSQPIRLEGHTDNVPIHNEEFASNWDLSSWRAIEVTNLLIERFGIAPRRLSVVGYGELRPVADNVSPEGRAANRRVDVVILSRSAAAMAPQQKLRTHAAGADL